MPEPCPSNPDCPQCHGDGVYGGIDSRPCYCTTCLPLPLQAKEYEIDFKEFDGLSRMILVPRLAIRGDWRNAKGRCVHWLGHLLRIVGVKPIANSTFEFGEPDEVGFLVSRIQIAREVLYEKSNAVPEEEEV